FFRVAPHAGAWIETRIVRVRSLGKGVSRPTRARGLKRCLAGAEPHGGRSRPTRARGLKPQWLWPPVAVQRSRPTRARGLKHGSRTDSGSDGRRAPRGRVD